MTKRQIPTMKNGYLTVPFVSDGGNIVTSGAFNTLDDLGSTTLSEATPKIKSFIGSMYQSADSNWYSMISMRHRNGDSDGSNFGFNMYTYMTKDSPLYFDKQYNGVWRGARQIIDSSGGTIDGNLKVNGTLYDSGNRTYPLTSQPTSIQYIQLFSFDHDSQFLYMQTPNYSTVGWGISIWASDRKLKDNIKDTEVRYALDKISQLKHVEFDWKTNDGHIPLGYVADDVKEILPCLVFEVPNGESGEKTLHINHTTMIPLITMGIQELIEEKDLLWNFDNLMVDEFMSLQNTVNEQQNEINSLKNEVEELKDLVKELIAK